MCRAADRLSLLCQTLNLTPQQFTHAIGLPQCRANCLFKTTRAPSRPLIARVIGAFPHVAATWLLTGQGPMLLPTSLGNYIANNFGHVTQISGCSCTDTISTLRAHLAEKERFIQHLIHRAG